MTELDPLDLLRRALDQAGEIIAAVRPDQATLPTPCQSWDVSQLTNHMVLETRLFTEMARGAAYQPGELHLGPGDWLAAFETGAAELLTAWGEHTPLDQARANRLSQQIAEFAVHGWDIVRATAQARMLDNDVAAHALVWARGALQPEMRGEEGSGKVFGFEVPITADGAIPDQLAAFFGRQP
jgi:uncharacterized protein (TIGR03086 family)